MVLLMALTANFAPQAGAQTIRDANHHNIGRISPNGTVRDNDSRPIGFFDRDGVIRNKNRKQEDNHGFSVDKRWGISATEKP